MRKICCILFAFRYNLVDKTQCRVKFLTGGKPRDFLLRQEPNR